MKKYKLSYKTKDIDKNRKVYLVILWRIDEKKIIEGDDIMSFIYDLGLRNHDFDHVYSGYDIREFVSNENFDLSLFYIDPTPTVSIYILCKNNKSQKKLEELLKKIKNLNELEWLSDK